MPFQQFYELFPEVGIAETRSIAVLTDDDESGLPPGDYGFCEMFCNERGCMISCGVRTKTASSVGSMTFSVLPTVMA